jgi:hypothetical protein
MVFEVYLFVHTRLIKNRRLQFYVLALASNMVYKYFVQSMAGNFRPLTQKQKEQKKRDTDLKDVLLAIDKENPLDDPMSIICKLRDIWIKYSGRWR